MKIIAVLIFLRALRCPAQSNPLPAAVVIESVMIDGHSIFPSNGLPSVKVRADQEQLEVHYTAPGNTLPNGGHFRYRVEGFDADWIDAGNARFARLGHIPRGRYRFVVQSNQDGTWNEKGATLFINVSIWSRDFQSKLLWSVGMLLVTSGFGSLLYFLIHRRGKEENPTA
jgi:hypothetical protein